MKGSKLLRAIARPNALSVVFQPIIDLQRDPPCVHAVECLTRGPLGSPAAAPEMLFRHVRRWRAETIVDRSCISAALQAARRLSQQVPVSLNVHGQTLGEDLEFGVFLGETAERYGIALDRVIVEIVRPPAAQLWSGFVHNVMGLRDSGVRIALDNLGAGATDYRMILDCRPDFLKVDRYLLNGVYADFYRQAILESVAVLASRFGARTVAAGVENAADLKFVRSMGIHLLVQGCLFARPSVEPERQPNLYECLAPLFSEDALGREGRSERS